MDSTERHTKNPTFGENTYKKDPQQSWTGKKTHKNPATGCMTHTNPVTG